MKARNLASPQPSVRADAPASEAAGVLVRHDVRAIFVEEEPGRLLGVLSDADLLRCLLPPYVEEDAALARVLDEAASDVLRARLQGRRARDLVGDRDVVPEVDGDDTVVEVASAMVRAHAPLVGVRDGGRLIGGITIDDLLSHLLKLR